MRNIMNGILATVVAFLVVFALGRITDAAVQENVNTGVESDFRGTQDKFDDELSFQSAQRSRNPMRDFTSFISGLYASRAFMQETLDWKGGIVPHFDSHWDHMEIRGRLGRPLTELEEASLRNLGRNRFRVYTCPEVVGKDVSELEDDQVILMLDQPFSDYTFTGMTLDGHLVVRK